MNNRVLIIDDDPDIIESMKTILESQNYIVLVAETGEEGINKAISEKPDVIILDVMLETMDKGFEVSRVLKNKEETKKIPILMLTAIKERTKIDFKQEAGDSDWLPVDDFCDKPLKPEELIIKVKNLINKK